MMVAMGRAIAPSGASKGINEALEKEILKKFLGLSVDKNIIDIKGKINKALNGQSVLNQKNLDNILIKIDGTTNKSVLGGNTTIAVSMATLKAAAQFKRMELWQYLNSSKKKLLLPIPQVQIFGGGAHANNQISIQDFLIIPNGAKNFIEAMEWVFIIFKNTHEELKKEKNFQDSLMREDIGLILRRMKNILIFLSKMIEKSGFKLLKDVSIALDVAANNFYKKSFYNFNNSKKITVDELLDIYIVWFKKFPIISIEDPFSENDILYYKKLKNKVPKYVQIIGDDLVVTNKQFNC